MTTLTQIDKESNGRVTIHAKGITTSQVNTLRRIALQETPTMAIDEVEISQNTSALEDEVIAHRLGLIVLKTDLKSYTIKEECTCKGEGCAKCTLTLSLKAKGPKTVYAEEINSKDPKVKPVHGKTPIVKLLKGQELSFEAIAILGKGSQHIKHSPGLIWYRNVPEITIDEKKCTNSEEVAKSCPTGVFEVKDGKLVLTKDYWKKCNFSNNCVEKNQGVQVNTKENEFLIFIEPWGQLSPKEILTESINQFEKEITEFEKQIK